MTSRLASLIKNPGLIVPALGHRGFFHGMDDEAYLKRCFKAYLGYDLDINHPTTFNEKLQWLKLHDRNPLYTTLVDKAAVKPWVAERIGLDHVVPTYGVWDSFEEIDFDTLPECFVLKCTHDSGGLVICRGRDDFDMLKARKKIEDSLKRNYYWGGREWPYKNVPPRILAEEYLEPEASEDDLTEYEFMCFDGKARCAFTYTDPVCGRLCVEFFDLDRNHLPFTRHYTKVDVPPDVPRNLHQMMDFADQFSAGIPFARADFYEVAGRAYFGELTFSPGSGFEEFNPENRNEELGSWMQLPVTLGGWLLVNDNDSVIMWLHMENSGKKTELLPQGMVDYKFYCFGGEPRFLYVSKGMEDHITARISFLSLDWEPMPFCRSDYRAFDELPEKPDSFNDMLQIARVLSANLAFVRVDLYEYKSKPMFSEMTFHPCAGFMRFEPPEWDLRLGSYLSIGA